jgi:putative alpha-1,2-mannosidase
MDPRRNVSLHSSLACPDCFTGSSGDNIVSHFAVTYHNEAAQLGIDLQEAYSALLTDGDLNPPEWNIMGRQVNVYKQYGYVPFAVLDTSSTGRQTREGSRTLEYAFEGRHTLLL